MRVFISLDIPKKIQAEIIKIQKQLPEFMGKKTEPENIHLTLKFLGEIDEKQIKKIKKKLKEIKFEKFEGVIDEIGVFSPKFIKIIWFHISNCRELQKRIDEKLSDMFEPEKRFMSHLTIARVKKIKDKKIFIEKLKKIKLKNIRFKINKFMLKKSILTEKGPIYETIEEYILD